MALTNQELQSIVEGVSSRVDARIDLVETRIQQHADTNLHMHEEHRKSSAYLRKNIRALWKRVRGNSDPPSEPTSDPYLAPPQVAPLDEQVGEALTRASENDQEIAALEGRMISGFAAVSTELKFHRKQNEELLVEAQKQSSDMGIGTRGYKLLVAPKTLRAIAAIGALVAAMGTVAHECQKVGSPRSAQATERLVP